MFLVFSLKKLLNKDIVELETVSKKEFFDRSMDEILKQC